MVILLINTILSYAIRVIICHACGSVYLMTAGLLRLFKTYFTFHTVHFSFPYIFFYLSGGCRYLGGVVGTEG